MTPAGFDTPANPPKKQGLPSRGDVNSDAIANGTLRNPAELSTGDMLLARLAAAWNRLTEADRLAVVELAERLAGVVGDGVTVDG
jgi:hypothetical protein